MNGCDRCRATSSVCTYNFSADESSRKRSRRWLSSVQGRGPARASKNNSRATSSTSTPQMSTDDRESAISSTSAPSNIVAGANPRENSVPSPNCREPSWQASLFGLDNHQPLSSVEPMGFLNPFDNVIVGEMQAGHAEGHITANMDNQSSHDLLDPGFPCSTDQSSSVLGLNVHRLSSASTAVQRQDTSIGGYEEEPRFDLTTSLPRSAPLSQWKEGKDRCDSTNSSSDCECVSMLANVLENLGALADGGGGEWSGSMECLLLGLGQGVDICSGVVMCEKCNICHDKSMLVATVSQQLGDVASEICRRLLADQQQQSKAGASNIQTDETSLISGMDICFGRYRVSATEMRVRLVRDLVAMHVKWFQVLLNHLSRVMDKRLRASKLLAEASENAQKAGWIIGQLRCE